MKSISPYDDETNERYLGFCITVIVMFIFLILFSLYFGIYLIHEVIGLIILCSLTFGIIYIFNCCMICLDPERLSGVEYKPYLTNSEESVRPKYIHFILILFALVFLICLIYLIVETVNVINLMEQKNNTNETIIVDVVWNGSFFILLICICVFGGCKWCGNVREYHNKKEGISENTSFLVSPSAPADV